MSHSEKASVAVSCILVLMLFGFGSSNIDQDRAECADQLVGLAPCLPFVGGDHDAKTPTLDCCTGLKQVEQKSNKCLCVLIKDRDDPKLGLKINASLALQLPSACHVPVNLSRCVDLLHLPANSPDAKMFRGYANKTSASSSAPISSANSTSSSTIAQDKSDGRSLGKGKRILGIEMPFGALLWFYTSHLVFYV